MKPLIHHNKPNHGTPIVCWRCHKPGGTLIKVNDRYEHQDRGKCKILQHTRPVPKEEPK